MEKLSSNERENVFTKEFIEIIRLHNASEETYDNDLKEFQERHGDNPDVLPIRHGADKYDYWGGLLSSQTKKLKYIELQPMLGIEVITSTENVSWVQLNIVQSSENPGEKSVRTAFVTTPTGMIVKQGYAYLEESHRLLGSVGSVPDFSRSLNDEEASILVEFAGNPRTNMHLIPDLLNIGTEERKQLTENRRLRRQAEAEFREQMKRIDESERQAWQAGKDIFVR